MATPQFLRVVLSSEVHQAQLGGPAIDTVAAGWHGNQQDGRPQEASVTQ